MSANGHKLKYKKFHLSVRKKKTKPFFFCTVRVVEHWSRFPTEFVELPSMEIFRIQLDVVLGNLLQLT